MMRQWQICRRYDAVTKDEVVHIQRLEEKLDIVSSKMVTMELLTPFFQSRDERFATEIKRIDDAMASHISYSKEISDKETKRVDSNREVDGKAVLVATDRASDAAAVLAKTLSETAETMRKNASDIATTLATQLQQFNAQFVERFMAIEKLQNENIGRAAVSDTIPDRIKVLEDAKSKGEGRSGLSAPLLMMIAGLCGGLLVYIVQSLIR